MIILLLREKREIADGTGLYTFHIQALKKKKKKSLGAIQLKKRKGKLIKTAE